MHYRNGSGTTVAYGFLCGERNDREQRSAGATGLSSRTNASSKLLGVSAGSWAIVFRRAVRRRSRPAFSWRENPGRGQRRRRRLSWNRTAEHRDWCASVSRRRTVDSSTSGSNLRLAIGGFTLQKAGLRLGGEGVRAPSDEARSARPSARLISRAWAVRFS